ncbi:MAG: DegT/DnrJ/EryC1/StrS family aminotransferase [Fastidiosipilaceae bacterium]
MAYKIFLSPPNLGKKELEYVKDAFNTNWIAPYGPAINAFEQEMAAYIGIDAALALNSGTAALHLALRWFGVTQGDIVFCSDFTFIGSCVPILYEKCEPVFIDSEPNSWNMSPIALEKAFQWAQRQNKMPKAVIIVDLYGESADWDSLLPICRKYGVPVIEDAAEALGTVYKGKKCASFGDISILSFNGNKIITTSGGGMVLSKDKQAIEKMRFWSTQAREPVIWYEHKEHGYNYRMSNICACIGRGQLEFLPHKLEKRKQIHEMYKCKLKGIPGQIKSVAVEDSSNYWLNLLCLDSFDYQATDIVMHMQNAEIECRPAWKPMHMQPLFENYVFFSHTAANTPSVDEDVFRRTLCLPSGDGMNEAQQVEVIRELRAYFERGADKKLDYAIS